MSVALGNRDEDTITSLAGRLARMDRNRRKDRLEIRKLVMEIIKEIINNLLGAVDPDRSLRRQRRFSRQESRG
jgi:type I restriction enzyme R subunit